MFESIQMENRNAGRRLWALLISMIIHVTVIGVLIIIPLIFFNVLPQPQLLTYLMTVPPPPPPPPPPAPPSSRAVVRPTPKIEVAQFTAPKEIPKSIPPPTNEPPIIDVPNPPEGAMDGAGVDGVPGGVAGGVPGGIPGSLVGPPPKPMPPPPPPPKPKPQAPIFVFNLQQSKLIRMVQPVYPALAKEARVSGTVILNIIVDGNGNVTEVKLLRGNPLLNAAAIAAVKQWKYAPTILDGKPVPVTSTVTVTFKLQGK